MFASADGFMELLLAEVSDVGSTLRPLFELTIIKTSTCLHHLQHQTVVRTPRCILRLLPSTFVDTKIDYADISILISRWTSEGIISDSGLLCRSCHPKQSTKPIEHPSYLQNNFKLEMSDPNSAPLHLYFFLDGVVSLSPKDRGLYQGTTNWPARIIVDGVEYMMITRGYWANSHYWCRVIRSVEGILGVWHYDERENSGIAQLEGTDVTSIAGCSPNTSWVSYSRMPREDEVAHIKDSIHGLMKLFPKNHATIPFSMPTHRFPFGGGLPLEDDQDSLSDLKEQPLNTADINNEINMNYEINVNKDDPNNIDNQTSAVKNKPFLIKIRRPVVSKEVDFDSGYVVTAPKLVKKPGKRVIFLRLFVYCLLFFTNGCVSSQS